MGISLKLIAKEILMAGCKQIPFVGSAIDIVDTISKCHETLHMQNRLQEIESSMNSFDRKMRDLVNGEIQQTLQGLSHRDLSGTDFTNHIRNLYDIQQNGWSPALFQGLLERSVHWNELCKNPSHYGSVLQDRQLLDPSKLPLFIDADKTRILELTPFALHGLLARQHDNPLRSNIVTSADVWAFVDGSTTKKPGMSLPKVGAIFTNSLGMQFAWVPPGESWLGGGGGKPGKNKFTLKQGMWCGLYPVTQAEWLAVMYTNPSHFNGNPRFPVESVSWNDVKFFVRQLHRRIETEVNTEDLLYRLPTAEEWEYICRGGPLSQDQSKYHFYFARTKTDLTSSPTNNISSILANFRGGFPVCNSIEGPDLQRPCDVGSYLPNPLGIHDLHGNVWEWSSSLSMDNDGEGYVIRGGCWSGWGALCIAALSGTRRELDYTGSDVGFRLVAVSSEKNKANSARSEVRRLCAEC